MPISQNRKRIPEVKVKDFSIPSVFQQQVIEKPEAILEFDDELMTFL